MINTDISIILTAHTEGILAGATIQSLLAAKADFESNHRGATEIIAVLDNSDSATKEIISSLLDGIGAIVFSSHSDPGLARNEGISRASGRFSTFLDADDLWSRNWLTDAWATAAAGDDCIYHSHCNIIFGKERNIWWHVDSESALFDPLYMNWANYWDALTFAKTEIYRRVPFRANDLKMGFGHEDWHWNRATLAASIRHRPVPKTIHFKRRRTTSQMTAVAKADCVVWPF